MQPDRNEKPESSVFILSFAGTEIFYCSETDTIVSTLGEIERKPQGARQEENASQRKDRR
jgi:hypothetical protein